MTIAPEKLGGIVPWRGPMEDPAIPKITSKPFVLNLPGRNKNLPPATQADDIPNIQWGCWWGDTDFEESIKEIDEDELRAAAGLPPINLGA